MKKIFGLILLVAMFGCEKDDDGGLKYPNILGKYTLITASSSWSETFENGNSTPYGESLMNDCNRNPTTSTVIELKKDGTFEHVSYESSDCVNKTVRTGTWKVNSTFFGDPSGEILFDDSPDVYTFIGTSIEGQPGTEIYYINVGFFDYDQSNTNIEYVHYDYKYRRSPNT